MSTSAANTKKSKRSRRSSGQISARPSGQDAVVALTQTGAKFSQDLLLKASILLLDGLASEILSPDLLYLSFLRAKDNGVKSGLDEQELVDALLFLHEHIEKKRQTHPLASMF